MKVFFYTLGCKLNQLETEALAGAFRDSGFAVCRGNTEEVEQGDGSLAFVNTCTVTSRADQKARRLIRLLLRRGSDVVVTGCYAELEEQSLAALGLEHSAAGKLFVVPGGVKDTLLDLPRYLSEGGALALWAGQKQNFPVKSSGGEIPVSQTLPSLSGPFRFNPRTVFHSRPFLKIQDGCGRSCAYCRVPLARGKSVSLDSAEILRRLKLLEDAGMAEAVIAGVNICQYRDSSLEQNGAGSGLAALLCFLLDHSSRICLRLSSIEPEPALFTETFFAVLRHPRIRSHIHLSVQSGSDTVLRSMGRSYTASDIQQAVNTIRSGQNDPFLACDIITGFPGETGEDFEKTFALCRDCGFAWIHAFPYSPRPGTPAGLVQDRVEPRIAGERVKRLKELAGEGRSVYIRRWLGKTLDAAAAAPVADISEDLQVKKGVFCSALTDNYIRVLVRVDNAIPPEPGTALRCIPEEAVSTDGFDALGRLVP